MSLVLDMQQDILNAQKSNYILVCLVFIFQFTIQIIFCLQIYKLYELYKINRGIFRNNNRKYIIL